jgi:hypothetical protein
VASRAPRSRQHGLARLLAIAGLIVAALIVVPALVPSLNPFREEERDRSGPVLLQSLEDLSEYRAATANLQVIVDVEGDVRLVPSFIKGERTLFLAAGSVDAAVDFEGIGKRPGAVAVSDDRRAATLTLPAPRLTETRLDTKRSRIYDRDRGVLDRIGETLSDDGGADQRELYALAEDKLRAAAAADPRLLETAERNTRAMLTGLLRGLGFQRITVRFVPERV